MSVKSLRNLAASALLLSAVLRGQISGPTSGVLYDAEAKALRTFMGVPGAGYLGGAIAENLDAASVSPDGRRAIAVRDGRLVLLSLTGAAAVDLGDWEGSLHAAAWSPESDAAALAGAAAVLVRELNGSPEVSPLASPGDIAALATGSHGDAVFAAAAGGIYRLSGEATLVAALEGASALALDSDGGVLYAASAGRKEIVAIRGLDSSAAVSLLLNETAGLDNIAGLGLSPDGATLYIADAGARRLSGVRASSGEPVLTLDLSVVPTRLDRAASLFVMNDRTAAESLEIFDPARQAVFFVPPGTPEPGEE
jgi:hypothetical protein